jgi:hypothetical protein
MATTYTQIGSTVTVGSGGAAAIEFTSIPSTYTDVVVKLSVRTNRSGSVIDGSLVRFNNDTTSGNYTGKRLYGDGSTATSNSSNILLFVDADGATANTFSNNEIYIPNYAGSTQKSFSIDGAQESNATQSYVSLMAGLWSGTAAITSVKITPEVGTLFNQYSSASLYGIKNS